MEALECLPRLEGGVVSWLTELRCQHCDWTISAENASRRGSLIVLANDFAEHIKTHEGHVSPIEIRVEQWKVSA